MCIYIYMYIYIYICIYIYIGKLESTGALCAPLILLTRLLVQIPRGVLHSAERTLVTRSRSDVFFHSMSNLLSQRVFIKNAAKRQR